MVNQGMDSTLPHPVRAALRDIALNYVAALFVLAFAYALYSHHPWLLKFYQPKHREWFTWVALFYAAVLPFYYATLPRGFVGKSRLALSYLTRCWGRKPTEPERVALLSGVIKLFFLPMMVMWLVVHTQAVMQFAVTFWHRPEFLPTGYWLLFNFAFWLDVFCFTVGYAIEHPRLGNEIRSVEPTVTGWAVTLACYPPFNDATVALLGWPTNDYPQFANPTVQAIACAIAIGFLAVYASASVALALKASNLTHRGVVGYGPYRWIRHPAYASKNLSWWIGALPVIATQWQSSMSAGMLALLGMVGWSSLYYVRAVTEERHLGRDPAYQEYCRQVRYRFIPGVW